MNNRLSVGGTLCDLEKGFDCVNQGSVDTLEFSGIIGKFQILINLISKVDTKMYSLVLLMHMIVFPLDGKEL